MSSIERVTTWSNDAVLDLLRSEHPAEIATAGWIGSGHWSDCFAFSADDGDHVVRIGRHVEDFRKDAVAASYDNPALPIPAVSKIGQVADEWFAISERVHGAPLEQSTRWHELIPAVADLLEGLRAVDIGTTIGWGRWDATGAAPSPTWSAFLLDVDQDPPESRVHGWKQNLHARPAMKRIFDAGYERLRLTVSDDVPRSLVHNDLINRNTHVNDNTVTGVFDWGNALYGDHLYDLALFFFWQLWLPLVQHEAVLAELRLRWSDPSRSVPDFERRFDACLLHIGLEHMAYHAFLDNWSEVQAVSDRMDAVVNSILIVPRDASESRGVCAATGQ